MTDFTYVEALHAEHTRWINKRKAEILARMPKVSENMPENIGTTEADLLFARCNSPEYQAKLASYQADMVARRKQREAELEKEREELEAARKEEEEYEASRRNAKPNRLETIIMSAAEIAMAEKRHKRLHPEPKRAVPVIASESDRLCQPYSDEYQDMLTRPAMAPEVADRVRANEVMSDMPPSQTLEHIKALEYANALKATAPRTESERYAMSQKSLPTMYAPHGWTDSAPDAETRRIRDAYDGDRRH